MHTKWKQKRSIRISTSNTSALLDLNQSLVYELNGTDVRCGIIKCEKVQAEINFSVKM